MGRSVVFGIVMVATAALLALAPPARLDADDDQYAWNNPQNRPGGTLIRNPATGEVFRVDGATRRLFPRLQDLNSFNYTGYIGIHDVSQDELSRLPEGPWIRAREGTVFRYAQSGDIYIIDEVSPGDYRKRYVTGAGWSAYFCAGYTYTNVDSGYLGTYADGAPVDPARSLRPDGQLTKTSSGSTTVYLVEASKLRKFVTASDRNTHNFPYPVCLDNLPAGPDIRARPGTMIKATTSPAVYMVDYGWPSSYAKRHIAGPDSLAFYGFNADPIASWPSSLVNDYANGPHIHPVKTLWPWVWNKSLVTNDLGTYTEYYPGTTPGSWDDEISAAKADWNAAPIAPDFFDDQTPPYDVDIVVDDYANPEFVGRADKQLDAQGKIWAFIVRLDASDFPNGSRHVVAHELGHVLLLSHDGMTNDWFDGECGPPNASSPPNPRVPQTIMDYDCEWDYGVSSPVNWDFCGVNHAHYSATWGWTGC